MLLRDYCLVDTIATLRMFNKYKRREVCMTVKYSKFKSICKNCGAAGEGYRYVRMSDLSFVICPSCADLLAKQLRSLSDAGKKQVEQ